MYHCYYTRSYIASLPQTHASLPPSPLSPMQEPLCAACSYRVRGVEGSCVFALNYRIVYGRYAANIYTSYY